MDAESDRCGVELSDARCDVLAYACLVAIMAQGNGYHCLSQDRLSAAAAANGGPALSSPALGRSWMRWRISGAADGHHHPHLKPLTELVARYLTASGIEVGDRISLEVADNLEVGCLDPAALRAVPASWT